MLFLSYQLVLTLNNRYGLFKLHRLVFLSVVVGAQSHTCHDCGSAKAANEVSSSLAAWEFGGPATLAGGVRPSRSPLACGSQGAPRRACRWLAQGAGCEARFLLPLAPGRAQQPPFWLWPG